MDTKRLSVEVKDADEDKGEVTAVFATFNAKDHDQDVTVPGAFDEGAAALISQFNHSSWSGALPAGKGTISTTRTEAVFNGEFFMDTTHGRDTFLTVKESGDLQEWSYGYDPVEFSFGEFEGERVRFLNKLKVFEVSPVMLGAGLDTRTLSAKRADMKFSDEAQAVVAAVQSLSDRAADVMAKRLEKGKGLGAESASLLESVEQQLKRLDEILRSEPEPGVPTQAHDDVEREFLRFMRAASRV